MHYWKQGRIGDFVVENPMILGHESAGEVVEVGTAVTDLKPGDRIALEPGICCDDFDKCLHCSEGKYNLCPKMRFFATPPIDGSLKKFLIHPRKWCFLLPKNHTT